METLSIERFNPKKAELIALSTRYKNLKIKGVDDKAGYAAVDTARKELKKARCGIQITGKELRADSVRFQKEVIARVNEFVAIIDPVEKELEERQRVVDEEREKIKRAELLPDRQARLEKFGVIATDDFLLGLDDQQFDSFANEEIATVLSERAEALRIEEERISREKAEADEKKRRELEIEEARKKATKEAEERAKREKEEAKRKAEQDKKDALAKAAQDKKDAIEKLKREQREKEEKAERERLAAQAKKEQDDLEARKEQERAEKNKKYKAWLVSNGIAKAIPIGFVSDDGYFVERDGNTFTLYKKVDSITI